MSSTNAPAAQNPALDNRHCVICAYPLRGLDPATNCPECGTPIARSLRGNHLAHANPRWLGCILAGTWLALASNLLSALAIALLLAQFLYYRSPDAAITLYALWAINVVIYVLATILLTRREPAAPTTRDPWRTRWFIRLTLALDIAAELLHVAMPWLIHHRPPALVVEIYLFAALAADVLAVMNIIAVMILLRRWMTRAASKWPKITLTAAIALVVPLALVGIVGQRFVQFVDYTAGMYYHGLPLVTYKVDEIRIVLESAALLPALRILHRAKRHATQAS